MVVICTEELQEKMASMSLNDDSEIVVRGKGREVFCHPGVHVYFINPQGRDNTKRDKTTVRLVEVAFEEQNAVSDVVIPPAFLEAGAWVYPLIYKKTPVYRTEENYYVFPDLLSKSLVAGMAADGIKSGARRTLEFIGYERRLAKTQLNPNFEIIEEYGHSQSQINACLNAEKENERNANSQLNAHYEAARENALNAESQIITNVETPKEYAGKPFEISSHAVRKLVDATSNLATYSTHYVQSIAPASMETINGTSAMSNEANFAINGAMHTMGCAYDALHNAGKTLASSINHNHVLDQRYSGGKGGNIMEIFSDAQWREYTAKVERQYQALGRFQHRQPNYRKASF